MRAFECCDRMVHIRVQLRGGPGLAFPLTSEQYLELEGQYFDLMLGATEGELLLPVPGGCFLPVDVAEIISIRLRSSYRRIDYVFNIKYNPKLR